MTPAAFARLLDVHGSDLARWPEAERPAATALLAHSPAAEAAWREARLLDALLDGAVPRVEGPDTAAIVALATACPQEAWTARRGRRRSAFVWVPAGALAACLGLGLLLGATRTASSATTASEILDLASGAGTALGEEP